MAISSESHEGKEQKGWRSRVNEGEIWSKLSQVNTKAVSKGQNKLISEFKMGRMM